MQIYRVIIIVSLVLISLFSSEATFAQDNIFRVVIDPGHGGKDTGTTGTSRYKKVNEKDIVLAVSLKVGKLLEEEMPEVEVIYTREADEFIELKKRGEIANKANADLFVSIHANAAGFKAEGTETYVLGIHRNETNLAVAKRENNVILLEEDYEKHYSYNPNSPASIIGLTLMQEDFLDQSIRVARLVENSFKKKAKRRSRGVNQAGFVVLHQTYMPSILIEIGFLTNTEEEDFLHSEKGQQKIANSIFKGIEKYKIELDKNRVVSLSPIEQNTNTLIFKDIIFKVQVASSANKVATKPYNFRGLKNIERVKVGAFYKYYLGATSDYNLIKKLKEKVTEKGYESAFVVALKGTEHVSVAKLLKSVQQ